MTIDERATSYSEMLYDEYETRLAQDTAYEGYISGATEQREIDIEKACKTYCRFCSHQCEGHPHDDCQVQIEFRKAMEE